MLIFPCSERGYRNGNIRIKKKNTEQSILVPVRIIVIVLLINIIDSDGHGSVGPGVGDDRKAYVHGVVQSDTTERLN